MCMGCAFVVLLSIAAESIQDYSSGIALMTAVFPCVLIRFPSFSRSPVSLVFSYTHLTRFLFLVSLFPCSLVSPFPWTHSFPVSLFSGFPISLDPFFPCFPIAVAFLDSWFHISCCLIFNFILFILVSLLPEALF
ncbi:hypothetical protein F5880DRAFT_478842 [Lentinula raphanica]|nr:hypothetical protein F5880DRAFT_478842 [Lentinula raphanica]